MIINIVTQKRCYLVPFYLQTLLLLLIFSITCIFNTNQIYANSNQKNKTLSYRIDQKQSSVTFTRKPIISDGRFLDFDGHLIIKNGQPHEIKGTIRAMSISTGDKDQDEDIHNSDNFFNKKLYPTITAKSVSIKKTDLQKTNNQYTSIFDITIQGITKQFSIPFELITENNNQIRVKSNFKISMGDFDIPSGDKIPAIGKIMCRFIVLRNASVKIDSKFYLEQ